MVLTFIIMGLFILYLVCYSVDLHRRQENILTAFLNLRNECREVRFQQEQLDNSRRLHSAQLKGAGERIRIIEAKLEGNTKTIDTILGR